MKKGKYLITGCAGFIGSNLVKNIFKENKLILVDDLSEGKTKNLPFHLRKKVIKKKIQDVENLNIKKIDGIFHLAAQVSVPLSMTDFYKSTSNNISSSIKVFELSKKYSAPVVYASSCAVYGDLKLGNDEMNNYPLLSPYAQDKLIIESYAKMSNKIFKVSSIGLRFFNVYGPGQKANSLYSSVIPIFIYRMFKKLPITINGGYQTRDFIYVNDVVNVMKKSMIKIQKKNICEIFNLGTSRSVKIDLLFSLIKKIIGAKPKIIKKGLKKYDIKKSSGTFKKIDKFFNFKVSNFTKIEDGLIKTINHLKKIN